MSNFDTVQNIVANVEAVLRGQGLIFSKQTYDDDASVPASLIPFGRIFYEYEDFEFTFGQRPKYAGLKLHVKVLLSQREPDDVIRDQQKWLHIIRDSLTINALNIGGLSLSKLVSRVETAFDPIENKDSNISVVSSRVTVRYREV